MHHAVDVAWKDLWEIINVAVAIRDLCNCFITTNVKCRNVPDSGLSTYES